MLPSGHSRHDPEAAFRLAVPGDMGCRPGLLCDADRDQVARILRRLPVRFAAILSALVAGWPREQPDGRVAL